MIQKILMGLGALSLIAVMIVGVAFAQEEDETDQPDTYEEAPLAACAAGVRATAILYNADGTVDEAAAHGGDIWTGSGQLAGQTYKTATGKNILTVESRLDRGDPSPGETCPGTLQNLGISSISPAILPASGSFTIDITLRYCLAQGDGACPEESVTGTFGAFMVEEMEPTPDETSPTPASTTTTPTPTTASPTPTVTTASPSPSSTPTVTAIDSQPPAMTLSKTAGGIGDPLTIAATGFAAGSNLTAWWDPYQITEIDGTVKWSGNVELNGGLADASGKATLEVSIPQETYAGQHTVQVSNPDGQTVRADVTVTESEGTATIFDTAAILVSEVPPQDLTENEGFVAGRLVEAAKDPLYREPFPLALEPTLVGGTEIVTGGTLTVGECQLALLPINQSTRLVDRFNSTVVSWVSRALAQSNACAGISREPISTSTGSLSSELLAQALSRLEQANLSHLVNYDDPIGDRFLQYQSALDAYLTSLNGDLTSVDRAMLDRANEVLLRYEDPNNYPSGQGLPDDVIRDREQAITNARSARSSLSRWIALLDDPTATLPTHEFEFIFNPKILDGFPIAKGLNEIVILDGDREVGSIILSAVQPTPIRLTNHKIYQIRYLHKVGQWSTEYEFVDRADNSWHLLKGFEKQKLGAYSEEKIQLAERLESQGVTIEWEEMNEHNLSFFGNLGSAERPEYSVSRIAWRELASDGGLLRVFYHAQAAAEVAWVDPKLVVDWNTALAASVQSSLPVDTFGGLITPRTPAEWEQRMHPFDVARRTDGVEYQEIVCYGYRPFQVVVAAPATDLEPTREERHWVQVAILHTEQVALESERIADGNWNGIGRSETCDDVVWRTGTDGLPNPIVEYTPRGAPIVRLTKLTTPHHVFVLDDVTLVDKSITVVPKELARNHQLRLEAEAKSKENLVLALKDRDIDIAFRDEEGNGLGQPYIANGPWDEPGLARAADLLACAEAGTCSAPVAGSSTGTTTVAMDMYPILSDETIAQRDPLAVLAARDDGSSQLAFAPTNYLELEVTGGPLALLVTDPTGRSVGFNSLDGKYINQLGEAIYTGAGTTKNQLLIPGLAQGTYLVKLIGLAAGDYQGTIQLALGGELVTKNLSGTLVKDEVQSETLEISLATVAEQIIDSQTLAQSVAPSSSSYWWWVVGVTLLVMLWVGIRILRLRHVNPTLSLGKRTSKK